MNAVIRFHSRKEIAEILVDVPIRVSDLLRLHSAPVDMPCAGQGICGKCRIRIMGSLSPMDDVERHALSDAERRDGWRLACRTTVLGRADIWLKETKTERILTSFCLPALKADADAKGVGLAFDIGTTTLAAYLYDMETHALLAVRSMPNPQRSFGADVTSRLKAALEGQAEDLRQAIIRALHDMTVSALVEARQSEADLHQAVMTGNTAMLYLLTGQEPRSIAFAPFVPATRMGLFVPGDQVGLFAHTRVWLPDCISAYVGADITCALLYAAAQPEHQYTPILLADVGTNGEMALLTGKRMLTCSAAAGPAFEGAGIRFGMTAQPGAICRVDVQDMSMAYSVIGDVPATGICGSGLVDAIAALRALDVVDETGRMNMVDHPLENCMEMLDGQPAFHFPNSPVLLTQADIRAIQLAKSAICSGMLTLLDEACLSPDDVRTFQLAGGFGSCIRSETAEAIGLIPSGFASHAHALGNAAGAGAAMMLLSDAEKVKGTSISLEQQTIELSSSAAFSEHFMDCMLLDPCC